jgi:hypothetical protein
MIDHSKKRISPVLFKWNPIYITIIEAMEFHLNVLNVVKLAFITFVVFKQYIIIDLLGFRVKKKQFARFANACKAAKKYSRSGHTFAILDMEIMIRGSFMHNCWKFKTKPIHRSFAVYKCGNRMSDW